MARSSRDPNVVFCRILLRQTHRDVKRLLPKVNLRKAAWVHDDGGTWSFHTTPSEGVEKFYWYGDAYNAYEARSHGWTAYLDTFFPGAMQALVDEIERA